MIKINLITILTKIIVANTILLITMILTEIIISTEITMILILLSPILSVIITILITLIIMPTDNQDEKVESEVNSVDINSK